MLRFPFGDPGDPKQQRLGKRAGFVLLLGMSALLGVMAGLWLMYAINLPQMTELEHYRPSTTTELYDVHGKIFGSFASERRVVVPYSEIPPVLREAVLSIEDKNFFQNGGVNLVRVVGAALEDYRSGGKAQGASTLTMQLARNLFLSSEKTYGRKLQEIFLTLQIERHFTKDQIFGLYANQIYLGRGTYGFEAGSEYYFSKHLRSLTLPEAALLAGLPKGPEYYSPVRFPERAVKRRNLVLAEMQRDGKISAGTAFAAMQTPLVLHLATPPNTEAPYFVEEVRRQLEHEYGVDQVHGAGLKVYTTLDLDLQHAAEKAVLGQLAAYERRRGWKGKLPTITGTSYTLTSYKHPDWSSTVSDGSFVHALVTQSTPGKMTVRIGRKLATMTPGDWAWTGRFRATDLASAGDVVYVHVLSGAETAQPRVALEQDSGAQSSLMAVDNATGEVLAMVGGRDFALSQFNRATQSLRQVGSSFKIYDYTAAFEAGAGVYDRISDAATTFVTASGPYSPHDYESGYVGSMTMVDAFAESRNIPALRIADRLGIRKVIEVARRFGVTSPIPNFLPVAIGAADLTLSEQVASYSVFPNDGIRITPHYIRRVTQADGTPVETPATPVREVISLETARKMMVLLEAVINHGTGAQARTLDHALGGKTGTTNNYTDAWFLGFSPSITCGTWVGFDTRQSLGEKETGARAALPIWIDFMREALADRPHEQFLRANAPKRHLDVAVNNEAEPDQPEAQPDNSDAAPKTEGTADTAPAAMPDEGAARLAPAAPVPVTPQALNPSAAAAATRADEGGLHTNAPAGASRGQAPARMPRTPLGPAPRVQPPASSAGPPSGPAPIVRVPRPPRQSSPQF